MAEKETLKVLQTKYPARIWQKLQEIMEEEGYPTAASAIHQAIIDKHAAVFNYARKNKPSSTFKETAEQKVKNKQEEKDAKIKMREQEGELICEKLGGEIVDEGGIKVCVYNTWRYDKSYEQKLNVEALDEELLKTQFYPSKEVVQQRLKKEGGEISN